MANSNLIPINSRMFGKNYKFEMEILTELGDTEYRVIYGYEFAWKCSEETEPYIVSELLKIRPEGKGQKYTWLIQRDSNKALYKSSETGRCSSRINVGQVELIVNKLQAYDEIFYAEIIKKLNRQPGIAEFFAFKKSGQRLLQQDAADFKMSTGDYLFSMLSDEESNWEDYLECGVHG